MLKYKQIWHEIKSIRWLIKFNLTIVKIIDIYIYIYFFFFEKHTHTHTHIYIGERT